MDNGIEEWNDIIERGLAREVPGGLDPDLVARIESRIEREGSGVGPTAHRVGLFLPLLGAWLVLATALVLLHVQAAPAAYEVLLIAFRSVADGARLDLIATSGAAFLLAEAAARLEV